MSAKKKHLGRGLDALLGSSRPAPAAEQSPPAAGPQAATTPRDGDLRQLPVDLVQRGKYQPRKDIEPESLQELADSIKAQGVMQPIVVRPVTMTWGPMRLPESMRTLGPMMLKAPTSTSSASWAEGSTSAVEWI